MNNSLGLASALAICLAFTCSMSLAAHPYHVSLTEIEWNSKSGCFEVAVCLWPSDLEKALSQQEQQLIDLDKAKNLDDVIAKYVRKNFVCSKGDEKTVMRWVGFETNNKQTWIYFELKPDQSVQQKSLGWKLKNSLFFELNEDQQNHINFVHDKNRVSLISTFGDPEIELGFD